MKNRLLKSLFLTLVLILLLGVEAKSQRLVDMTFSSFIGSYSPASGGTLWTTVGDDNVYLASIPFQFKYDNTMFSQCWVSCNGYLCFTPGDYNYSGYYLANLNDVRPAIQCMRRDLYTYGGLSTITEGVAPNRCFIVQWGDVDFYYSNSAHMNFQIRLYETSNIVQIVYGSMERGNYNFGYASCGFSGIAAGDWINVQAGSTFQAHFSKNTSDTYGPASGVRSNTEFGYFGPGLTLQLSAYPSLVSTFPAEGTILQRGQVYTGSSHPSVDVNRITGQQDVYIRYSISGPMPATNPDYKEIYKATKETDLSDYLHYLNPQPIGMPGRAPITNAIGLAARQDPDNDGALDLFTNQDQIPGGQYVVKSELVLPSSGNYTQTLPDQTFVIALENDLAMTAITSPKEKKQKIYPLTSLVPISARFTNIGITPVSQFWGKAEIYNAAGILIYSDSIMWNANGTALTTGQSWTMNFRNFRPSGVGDFKIVFTSALLSSRDDELSNNRLPKVGTDWIFRVNYEIEAEPIAIIAPAGQIYVGRPVLPKGRYQNNGVSDISDVPAKMVITDPTGDTIFVSNSIVQDIPSGRINTSEYFFNDNFIPPAAGTYRVCLTLSSDDDPMPENNTICSTFEVIHALAGVYTIGLTNQGGSRNFNTFQEAVDAMYQKGLTGAVTFELTDDVYNVGMVQDITRPSLDLRSKIVGVSAINTITFKPAQVKSIQRGGITINLNTGSGIGVLFGQSSTPTNSYAAVATVVQSKIREFSNSAGYIIFDGGSQKAMKFKVNTPSNFRTAFYLSQGASNITIKDVLVENFNQDQASYACDLPLTVFEPGQSKFTFEKDFRDDGRTYSTGILLRSVAPTDKGSDNTNLMGLDTLYNQNNLISGTEINGFGYGIVSLGTGPLYHQGYSIYKHYYNSHNSFTSNVISNVARAGIFIGFEENSTIANNKIFGVTGTCGSDAAGIMVGGQSNSSYFGYNNMGINITGNEISGISSTGNVFGIKVEQSRNSYPHPTLSFVHFPDVNENTRLSNNVVWGLVSQTASNSRIGIALFTERKAGLSSNDKLLTPKVAAYNTRNDMISNNTVIMSGDAGLVNTGIVAGIAIEQANAPKLYNNAIAILDNEADASSPVFSAILYQGKLPKDGGLDANRNAYWIPSASSAAVYRFIETDGANSIIDLGSRDDYKNLSQWQIWTGEDNNSIFGDFTGDLTYTGSEPNRRLRVNGTPTGSILNNRGDRIDWLTTDIDGTPRGAAGQRYDIGAIEFAGIMNVTDMEVNTISSPAAYKSGAGMFNDAEYVMTKAPVEVKALIRNNGSIQASGVKATVKIYRETPAGAFTTSTVVQTTVTIAAATTETIEAAFKLADGASPDFAPQAYSDLRNQGYTVPDQFKAMQANVTPRYKIEVSVESDQNNTNNSVSKIVRFYIPRSSLNMLVTAENNVTTINSKSAADLIAGRLNYDSLMRGFNRIGWITNVDSNRYNIDIFDRLGWEPKTVDYSMYRTMLWSDGSDKSLTRFQRSDIRKFLANGTTGSKKNLVISSQEMVRANEAVDQAFVREVLSAIDKAPSNPLGFGASYDGYTIVGKSVGRGISEKVVATKFTGDEPPYAGLMAANANSEGLALSAYYYKTHTASKTDSVAGVAGSTLSRNVILVGLDWRHYANSSNVLRELIDFIEKNGGTVIPVELTDFNAIARDKRVDVSWTTASEFNSDRFEVERAVRSNEVTGTFVKIAEEKAAGKSTSEKLYGPVVDRNVEMNNTYVYRLRMFDKDGSYKLSQEVTAVLTSSEAAWLTSPAPNPAGTETTVNYSLPSTGEVEIALYDMAGRKVMTLASGMVDAGSHDLRINVSSLTSGTYTLMLTTGNETMTRQITVIK